MEYQVGGSNICPFRVPFWTGNGWYFSRINQRLHLSDPKTPVYPMFTHIPRIVRSQTHHSEAADYEEGKKIKYSQKRQSTNKEMIIRLTTDFSITTVGYRK